MKIAYISERPPHNINTWSGTPKHILSVLSKTNTVEWVGRDVTQGAFWHHRFLGAQEKFYVQDYADRIGRIVSETLCRGNYDVAITSSSTLLSHIRANIPIIFFTDAIFPVCQGVFFQFDSILESKVLPIEKAALERADRILLCSDFVQQAVVRVHGIPEEKTEVLEFGANIPDPIDVDAGNFDESTCRLVFVGRDWEWKGGQKVLDAFNALKRMGMRCQLTIIGCSPAKLPDDPNIIVIKWLNKADAESMKIYDSILREAHFMVLPTKFDAYGIVFCEASAYGVPSIAANVGGVSQPIRDGINGILMSPDANGEDYAAIIYATLNDRERYKSFRINSRHEFEHRLNWNLWGKRVNEIMTKLVDEYEERRNNRQGQSGTDILQEYYLPVYAFNLRSRPDRLANLKLQFENKPEFDVTYMEAVQHERGNVGLWKSICNAVRLAKERSEDLIVLCEDDHIFTEAYDKRLLIANIAGAYKQGAELLNCGIGGFGTAVPVDAHRSWVDWFWSTQFVVVFEPLFDKILSYDFQDKDTADGVLSSIALRPMVLHPAISAQMDCGYSDIAPRKNQSDFQNGIFRQTNQRMNVIHSVYNAFHTAK